MDFYFNENYLIKSEEHRSINLKEIKEIYDLLEGNNSKIYIKEDFDYSKVATKTEYIIALSILKKFKILSYENCDILDTNDIYPCIYNDRFIELISLCFNNKNDKIISNSYEDEVIHNEYEIDINEEHKRIINLVGIDKVKKFLMLNPTPQNISEVFERISNQFSHIKFTDISYKTANSRWEIYTQFGLERLVEIFEVLEILVYPFLKGDNIGCTEKDIISEFKKQTNGVEFSRESNATMKNKNYAKQRTITINGREIKMSYHIKVSDNRIYFEYDKFNNCIYIGHCGGHLYTVKYKGN